MGVTMFVGLMTDDMDDEDREYAQEDLAVLNGALREAGLPEHKEPEGGDEDYQWEFSMRFGVVEQLQDLAADLKQTGALEVSDETLAHLIDFGGEGFYVPADFVPVVQGEDELDVASSVRLKECCAAVARALDFPVALEAMEIDCSGEGDELWDFMQEHKAKGGKWTEFEAEMMVCAVMFDAARESIKTGKVIGFG